MLQYVQFDQESFFTFNWSFLKLSKTQERSPAKADDLSFIKMHFSAFNPKEAGFSKLLFCT
ncbi:MAG: hypothetical protein ACJAU0_002267 [Flavobacteriales bacterium]|jgi:hypothetical protein